ncbi:uncharacterized protein LOC116604693 isoform X2 [Nematostella vectensis]|nr:uncharacterized protein LOC116604693 isoform X2 [Nematostella vectensis]
MRLTECPDRSDGYKWRCPTCHRRTSVRMGSFFGEFPRIRLATMVEAIHHWAKKIKQKTSAEMLGISERVVGKISSRLRDICAEDLRRRPVIPFGGPGIICEIDESLFNHKAKYNRGRRPADANWVFGVLSTEHFPSRGYFRVVQRRDAATLLPIIEQALLPGSTVHTDDWAAYRQLQARLPNVVADHGVVVHRYNFVDPITGVHTQHVESAWNRLKSVIKERRGVRRVDLQSFLDEQCWRDWRTSNRRIFYPLLSVLRLHFPL